MVVPSSSVSYRLEHQTETRATKISLTNSTPAIMRLLTRSRVLPTLLAEQRSCSQMSS